MAAVAEDTQVAEGDTQVAEAGKSDGFACMSTVTTPSASYRTCICRGTALGVRDDHSDVAKKQL